MQEPIITIDVTTPPPDPPEAKLDLDYLIDLTLVPHRRSDGTLFIGFASRGKTLAVNFDRRPVNFLGSPHILAAQVSLHPGRGTIGIKIRNQFNRYAFGGFRNVDGFPIASIRVPVRGSIIKFMSSTQCEPI